MCLCERKRAKEKESERMGKRERYREWKIQLAIGKENLPHPRQKACGRDTQARESYHAGGFRPSTFDVFAGKPPE